VHARILVVDDDTRSLMAMQELLRSPGQSIVVASSGAAALKHVQSEDFAVILLDARMPVVDGFETARKIREFERSRHTPIIFLTGAYEDPPSMFRGYEAGAVDYIVKPLVPEILKSKIAVFVELYNKNAYLRALAMRLQSVQEDEQRRIARDIHDELGQALTALKMDLSWLSNRLPAGSEPLQQKAKTMSGLIDGMVRTVREVSARLRPEVLDELGLVAAIKWQARDFEVRAGIRCKVDAPVEDLAIDLACATAVFRVFQELLTNVARHAPANQVDVSLHMLDSNVQLEVRDNGRGIRDAEIRNPASLGLLGMRERVVAFGGRVKLEARGSGGTRATVTIPIEACLPTGKQAVS